jgi:isopenicillin-N N-acyltransferase-like protein
MMDTRKMDIFELSGDPKSRGHIHGETLKTEIHQILEIWKGRLSDVFGLSIEQYVDLLFGRTMFRDSLSRHAGFLLEEIEAIASSSDTDIDTLLAFQHVNESFMALRGISKKGSNVGESCSTITQNPVPSNPTYLAQNLDLSAWMDGFQVLFRSEMKKQEGQLLLYSLPGMICLNGLNSFGVGVVDNALTQLNCSPSGLPVFAIYRLILECSSAQEVATLLENIPHATGLNWVFGDPIGAHMYECSATQVVPVTLFGQSNRLFHTNHPLCNGDQSDFIAWENSGSKLNANYEDHRSTYLRQAALHNRLGDFSQDICLSGLLAALASKDDPNYPVSKHAIEALSSDQMGATIGSVVMELDPNSPKMHLAAGAGHIDPYVTIGFE